MPESLIPFPPDAFRPFITVLAIAIALVILFIIFFAGTIAWMVVHGVDLARLQRTLMGLYGVEVQTIAEIVAVAFLALVLPRLAHRSLHDLGFRPLSVRDIGIIAAGIVAMFVFLTGLGSLLTSLLGTKTQEAAVSVFMHMRTPGEKTLFALFGVVAGPCCEEFFFRTTLLNAMRKWWGFRPAVVVSSLAFGFAHWQPGGPATVVALILPLTLGGVILALVYARTGNAWANMIVHAGFNTISLLLILAAPQLAK